jgi:threonine dehydratase
VVYVPIGQGSGICAAAAARNVYSPGTRLVGVVSAHAACFSRSFAARRVVEAPVQTLLGDGMACRKPDEDALSHHSRNVARVLEVTDAELAGAMRAIFSIDPQCRRGRRRRGVCRRLARSRVPGGQTRGVSP